MNVDFRGLEVGKIVIQPFAGQRIVYAVINIGTKHQRQFFVVIFSCFLLFFMENIYQPVGINDRISFTLSAGHFNGSIDEMNVVIFSSCILRT